MEIRKTIGCLLFIFSLHISQAQDSSLLKILNDSMASNPSSSYVTGTFKGERIVNMQTVEGPGAGALTFMIQHRFGQLNSGAYNFFGLDNANIRLGLGYGITDRLAVGISRNSLDKVFDAYLKYKLLRQTDGNSKVPVTVSAFGYMSYKSLKNDPTQPPHLSGNERIAYVGQLLIARKFNNALSLQLAPTWLHYNAAAAVNDKSDEFSLGAAGRVKISKRMSINAEYNYLLPDQVNSINVYNSFSLGWDIETGGHVFQFVFSNSQGMTESQYIGRTTSKWNDGGIYFGFNISRNFNVSKHAKKHAKW